MFFDQHIEEWKLKSTFLVIFPDKKNILKLKFWGSKNLSFACRTKRHWHSRGNTTRNVFTIISVKQMNKFIWQKSAGKVSGKLENKMYECENISCQLLRMRTSTMGALWSRLVEMKCLKLSRDKKKVWKLELQQHCCNYNLSSH